MFKLQQFALTLIGLAPIFARAETMAETVYLQDPMNLLLFAVGMTGLVLARRLKAE
jgi:hypothetical protein